MNAPLDNKGNGENVDFFIPDPWSFQEQCKPKHLKNTQALATYASKNYLSLNPIKILQNGIASILSLVKELGITTIVRLTTLSIKFIWIEA